MKISYYPGCTLKTKAQNLEAAALSALKSLGLEVEELDRWNCCGAVFSLTDDDLIHQVAPTRVLIRAKDAGSDKVVTLCSQCYNTLARANQLVREDEEKRKTLNLFMTEETDYNGEVEVIHFLQLLRDEIGWAQLAEKVVRPLKDLKVAPFYGCTLLRPHDVAIDERPLAPRILRDFVEALGATPVDFPEATECCGAYEFLANPEAGAHRSATVVQSARDRGAEALVLSCPLCDYNLGRLQSDAGGLPVFYFSQLLAIALGLTAESARFDLNTDGTRALLKERQLVEGVPG